MPQFASALQEFLLDKVAVFTKAYVIYLAILSLTLKVAVLV
jgi:hypothetical protein